MQDAGQAVRSGAVFACRFRPAAQGPDEPQQMGILAYRVVGRDVGKNVEVVNATIYETVALFALDGDSIVPLQRPGMRGEHA